MEPINISVRQINHVTKRQWNVQTYVTIINVTLSFGGLALTRLWYLGCVEKSVSNCVNELGMSRFAIAGLPLTESRGKVSCGTQLADSRQLAWVMLEYSVPKSQRRTHPTWYSTVLLKVVAPPHTSQAFNLSAVSLRSTDLVDRLLRLSALHIIPSTQKA